MNPINKNKFLVVSTLASAIMLASTQQAAALQNQSLLIKPNDVDDPTVTVQPHEPRTGAVYETANDETLNILFPDGTTITLGADSRLIITGFDYDPETRTGNLKVELQKGLAKVTGGIINNTQPVTITTPHASLSLDNGSAVVEVSQQKTMSYLRFGKELTVASQGGTQSVKRAGFGVATTAGQAPASPKKIALSTKQAHLYALNPRLLNGQLASNESRDSKPPIENPATQDDTSPPQLPVQSDFGNLAPDDGLGDNGPQEGKNGNPGGGSGLAAPIAILTQTVNFGVSKEVRDNATDSNSHTSNRVILSTNNRFEQVISNGAAIDEVTVGGIVVQRPTGTRPLQVVETLNPTPGIGSEINPTLGSGYVESITDPRQSLVYHFNTGTDNRFLLDSYIEVDTFSANGSDNSSNILSGPFFIQSGNFLVIEADAATRTLGFGDFDTDISGNVMRFSSISNEGRVTNPFNFSDTSSIFDKSVNESFQSNPNFEGDGTRYKLLYSGFELDTVRDLTDAGDTFRVETNADNIVNRSNDNFIAFEAEPFANNRSEHFFFATGDIDDFGTMGKAFTSGTTIVDTFGLTPGLNFDPIRAFLRQESAGGLSLADSDLSIAYDGTGMGRLLHSDFGISSNGQQSTISTTIGGVTYNTQQVNGSPATDVNVTARTTGSLNQQGTSNTGSIYLTNNNLHSTSGGGGNPNITTGPSRAGYIVLENYDGVNGGQEIQLGRAAVDNKEFALLRLARASEEGRDLTGDASRSLSDQTIKGSIAGFQEFVRAGGTIGLRDINTDDLLITLNANNTVAASAFNNGFASNSSAYITDDNFAAASTTGNEDRVLVNGDFAKTKLGIESTGSYRHVQWGFFFGEADITANNEHVHLATWAAGKGIDINSIQSGTGVYKGHAIGNVYDATGASPITKTFVGTFENEWSFATNAGTGNFKLIFDSATFSGPVARGTTNHYQSSSPIDAVAAQRQANVQGNFVGNLTNGLPGGTVGRFSINDTIPVDVNGTTTIGTQYRAVGTFGGDRTTPAP